MGSAGLPETGAIRPPRRLTGSSEAPSSLDARGLQEAVAWSGYREREQEREREREREREKAVDAKEAKGRVMELAGN